MLVSGRVFGPWFNGETCRNEPKLYLYTRRLVLRTLCLLSRHVMTIQPACCSISLNHFALLANLHQLFVEPLPFFFQQELLLHAKQRKQLLQGVLGEVRTCTNKKTSALGPSESRRCASISGKCGADSFSNPNIFLTKSIVNDA